MLIANLMKIHYSLLKAGVRFEVSTSSSIQPCSFFMAVGQNPCRLSVSNISLGSAWSQFSGRVATPMPVEL